MIQWPRTRFRDCLLRGEVTLVDWQPGATWRLQARVADRSYGEDWQPVDQDLVQVELDPARGEATLSQVVDGKPSVLATGKIGAVARGRKTRFELSLQGAAAMFSSGGSVKLQATDKSGRLPAEGYFQWEQMPGLHAHLDNLRVTLDP